MGLREEAVQRAVHSADLNAKTNVDKRHIVVGNDPFSRQLQSSPLSFLVFARRSKVHAATRHGGRGSILTSVPDLSVRGGSRVNNLLRLGNDRFFKHFLEGGRAFAQRRA